MSVSRSYRGYYTVTVWVGVARGERNMTTRYIQLRYRANPIMTSSIAITMSAQRGLLNGPTIVTLVLQCSDMLRFHYMYSSQHVVRVQTAFYDVAFTSSRDHDTKYF